jgi:hypothetical protein
LINDYLETNKLSIVSIESLKTIDGISDKLAQSYLNGIDNFNIFYDSIKHYVTLKKVNKVIVSQELDTYNCVFSGIRDSDLESFIVSNGGKIGSGISKVTTHLVMKEIKQNT